MHELTTLYPLIQKTRCSLLVSIVPFSKMDNLTVKSTYLANKGWSSSLSIREILGKMEHLANAYPSLKAHSELRRYEPEALVDVIRKRRFKFYGRL